MKMTQIMLAAAAVCAAGVAHAQSNVSIYGQISNTVEFQKEGSDKATKVESGGSLIGFQGTEDLGGGLKAGFILESEFESDTGAGDANGGLSFAAKSELFLEGDSWGAVRLGNFTLPSALATMDVVSMHNADYGTSADALYEDVNNQDGNGNTLSWRSPEWNGVVAEVSTRFDEQAKDSKNLYDLAVNYTASDALSFGAGYTQHDKDKQFGLRASYAVGDWAFGAYVQRNDTVDQGKRTALRLAAMYTMGANEFHLNVGRAGKWSKVADSSATQYTVAYNYNMSKRTKLYAFYTTVKNKAGADYGVNAAGADFRSVAFGIRHSF